MDTVIDVQTRQNKDQVKNSETILQLLSVGLHFKPKEVIAMLPQSDPKTPIQEYTLPITPNSSPISQPNSLHYEFHTVSGTQIYDSCYLNGIIIEEYVDENDKCSTVSTNTKDDSVSDTLAPIADVTYNEHTKYDNLMQTIELFEDDSEMPTETVENIPEVNKIHGDYEKTEKLNGFDSGMGEQEDDDDVDNSSEQDLTNLGWLIDLKNLTTWSESGRNKSSANPTNGGTLLRNINIIDDIDDDDGCFGPTISDKDLSEERFNKFMSQVKQSQINYAEREHIYKVEPMEKPPFHYAQIIAMAMMENGRMTLKDICKWIQERFAYFRFNKNWNNSIRHNLSLHFCFTKIARDKTEKGKGGYWELSMNTAKSEKKRVRNRKKHRDESGRFSMNLCKSAKSNNVLKSASANLNERSRNPDADDDDKTIKEIAVNTTRVQKEFNQNVDEIFVNDLIIINSDITSENNNDLNLQIAAPLYSTVNSEKIFFDDDISLCDTPMKMTPSLKHPNLPKTRAIEAVDNGQILSDVILCNYTNNGPNVIVEPLPYGVSHMDTVLDYERELLDNMPDPVIIEDTFYDYW